MLKWLLALAVAGASWGGVTAALLQHARTLPPVVAVRYVEAPCSKPWMTARDERAVCAMEAAARDWATANPGKVKR